MSNILEPTQVATKGNRVERFRLASKLRFTSATYMSLINNIQTNKIVKSFEKYNKTYEELRSAIVSAEVAAAENQARASATQDEKHLQIQKEDQSRLSLIKEDEQVAKIASVGVAKRRFASLNVDVHKLSGNFGTLGNNFGVNVKPKYLPKALSVPRLYSKVYTQILKNVDLYKFSDKVDVIDPSLVENQLENGQQPSKIPSWRKLFENSTQQKTTDVMVAMNSQPLSKDNEEENTLDIPPIQKGVSTADLSHRNLLAQINDELEDLRKLRSSPNGFTSPFDSGLEERENNLLSMLVSISGIESGIKKKKPVLERPNTEFQNLIEDIVGYTAPMSEEEYQKKAQEMQDYYSDPEVEKTIEDLRHKDILFSFNDPESYNRVMEAERKDNERIAQKATALEVIGNEPMEQEDEETQETILSLGSIEQAKQLYDRYEENKLLDSGAKEEAIRLSNEDEKNRIIIGAQEQAKIFADQDERNFVINGAQEQAKIFADQDERNFVINGAKEQAKIFADQDERNFIINGAKEQAKMLKTLNDFMKIQAQMEKANKEEKDFVIKGAQEQAENLFAIDERSRVINGAKEQANEIIASEEKAKIINGAEEQAKEVIALEEKNRIIEGAKEQAQNIKNEEEKKSVILGAQEQAKNIISSSLENSRTENNLEIIDIEKNETSLMEDLVSQMAYHNISSDDILAGAKEQAQNLYDENEKQISIEGAKEQAMKLYNEDEKNRIVKGSIVQARNIYNDIETKRVRRGAQEQAENLFAADKRKSILLGAQEQANAIVAQEETNKVINGAKEQAENIIAGMEKQNVIRGSEEQAQSLFDAYLKSLELKTNTLDLSPLKCVALNINDRYCSFVSPSRPLKIRAVQKANFDKRIANSNKNSKAKTKEVLTSLKEQLDSSPEFDFLRYDENVIGRTRAA